MKIEKMGHGVAQSTEISLIFTASVQYTTIG